jgi:hypothetical protein
VILYLDVLICETDEVIGMTFASTSELVRARGGALGPVVTVIRSILYGRGVPA